MKIPKNKIINMDNLKGLARLPNDCIDLTVTSVPYDDVRKYEGYTWSYKNLLFELYRVTKPHGFICWQVQNQPIARKESMSSQRQALYAVDVAGFNLFQELIIQTNGVGAANKRYPLDWTHCYVLSKGKPEPDMPKILNDRPNVGSDPRRRPRCYRNPDGEKCYSNIDEWNYYGYRSACWLYAAGGVSTKDMEAFEHPSIMPEKLARDLIRSFSRHHDLVLDPFMGSGTTAKAAYMEARSYLGYDVSKNYCKLAKARLAKAREDRHQQRLEMLTG